MVFSFLEASTLVAHALSDNPWGRKANPRTFPPLLENVDASDRKPAWWGFPILPTSCPQNVAGLFDRIGTRVSSSAILDRVSSASTNALDKTHQNKKLAQALFGVELPKRESKLSKPVDIKVRASQHTTPYRIQTEERRNRIAAGKHLRGYQHASVSFPFSKRTGRPTPLSKKYNNQPRYKPTGRN